MHPIFQICLLLIFAAGCTAVAGISGRAALQKYDEYTAPISLGLLVFSRESIDINKNQETKVRELFNNLDRAKNKADNYLETSISRNENGTNDEEKLLKLRGINDYSFKIFRDMWFIQVNWFKRNGRYFQGLKTMDAPPYFGELGEVKHSFGLTGQVEGWADIGYIDKHAPVLIKCDVYESPQGHGYKVTVSFSSEDSTYSMYMHVGPDEDRFPSSFEWQKDQN